MKFGGWISIFSASWWRFGIANIMFVSVRRCNLIGIQKSLRAKNKFILFQFYLRHYFISDWWCYRFVSCVGIALFLTKVLDFEFVLEMGNILLGTVAALIGLISGILPTITASKLDPVEAIRTNVKQLFFKYFTHFSLIKKAFFCMLLLSPFWVCSNSEEDTS
jgi:putative ABC transport system permease protein